MGSGESPSLKSLYKSIQQDSKEHQRELIEKVERLYEEGRRMFNGNNKSTNQKIRKKE
jgi:hypothetical protein